MHIEPLSPDARLPWEGEANGPSGSPAADLPGVSVVIPIYNSANFLEKTLRSLMLNHAPGVELIVMDGGSTDDTPRILDHYREMFSVVVSEPDRGQSDAINKGFARATQPILYWLNGDDILLPGALDAVRRAFAGNPGTEVVVGDAYMTEKDFSPIRHFRFSPETLRFAHLLDYAAHHLVQPSVFFTRAAWDAAGPVKEEMHYAMDADLFLAMAKRFDFLHLPRDLGYSVYHEECKTRDKRAESITELAMVQAAHGGMEEARRTLDILVQLYNESREGAWVGAAEEAPAEAEPAGPQRVDPKAHDLLARRLAAVEAERARDRQLLLDSDIVALT